MPKSIDLSGHKYNHLTVVGRTNSKTSNGQWRWTCICDCGTETVLNTGNIRGGRTKSCGCLQRRTGEASPNFKHGLSRDKGTPEFKKYQRECADRHHYKLEPEHKQAMLDAQSGGCAICGYKFGQKKGDMRVDHCHATGVVRGLLCDHCNRGLGFFRDNSQSLENASAYVQKFALAR